MIEIIILILFVRIFLNDCDVVVVGCTELPLIIKQEDYQVPILDTLDLYYKKAVDFALSDI